jgi:hypothetical protein
MSRHCGHHADTTYERNVDEDWVTGGAGARSTAQACASRPVAFNVSCSLKPYSRPAKPYIFEWMVPKDTAGDTGLGGGHLANDRPHAPVDNSWYAVVGIKSILALREWRNW